MIDNSEKLNIDTTKDEMMITFLSSAITDISSYIHLSDTKVSIIMGSMVALVAGCAACYSPIDRSISCIKPWSIIGVLFIFLSVVCILSGVSVFLFGVLTISGHVSNINYKSKWFITGEYSFDEYLNDIKNMSNKSIIENMSAELYKLNDINRQKSKTVKCVMISFETNLLSAFFIGILFLIIAS